METFWESFRVDPRVPANARLRASDADRGLVTTLLDEAYADGRLSAEEHDQRVTAALTAVTLGDLPPLVADLLPVSSGPSRTPAVRAGGALEPATVEEQAVAAYRRDLREAWTGFVVPSVICWVIWLTIGLSSGFHFAWPVFVMLSGIGVITTRINREEIIAKHRAKIERRELRRLSGGSSEPDALPGPDEQDRP